MRPLQTKLADDQIAVVTKRVGLKVGNVQVGKAREQVAIGVRHLIGTIGNFASGQLQARRADGTITGIGDIEAQTNKPAIRSDDGFVDHDARTCRRRRPRRRPPQPLPQPRPLP